MNRPQSSDYINFHDHGSVPVDGVFSVDNIMVHEGRSPSSMKGITHSVGAHPWFIDEDNFDRYLLRVRDMSGSDNVIAIGETGFDKLKGPSVDLQRKAFERHFELAEELSKPLIIHCVRAWPEILAEKKRLKPKTPWVIHGFKGKKELAQQLCDKGFYLSAWVEWAIRPVSADTLNNIPPERLFLETDGFDIGIEPVYKVVAGYLGMEVEKLREQIYKNYTSIIK
ncbi:MAG: TatD family hydrolase [Marinilabiliaceae bacterium]|nr:TatD family hydrolase [Marinilabiliaceae bacterium]